MFAWGGAVRQVCVRAIWNGARCLVVFAIDGDGGYSL